MADCDIIARWVLANPGVVPQHFNYNEVKGAPLTITAKTSAGLDYAVLRFLQKYCDCINAPPNAWSAYATGGDPRKSPHLYDVRRNWFFSLRVVGNQPPTINPTANINPDGTPLVGGNLGNSPGTALWTAPLSSNGVFLGNMQPIEFDFVKYLVEQYLPNAKIPTYNWNGNFIVNQQIIERFGQALWASILTANSQTCFDTIQAIMNWGGVWMRQRIADPVILLHKDNKLITTIIDDSCGIMNNRPANISQMNAGWTKVMAVLLPSSFAMLDSRVSKAMCDVINVYMKFKSISTIPSSFHFAQTVAQGTGRHVPGFPVATGGVKRIKANLWISKILVVAVNYANITKKPIFRNGANDLRDLEAQLFMLGK